MTLDLSNTSYPLSPYLLRPVSQQEVVDRIHLDDPATLPDIILGVAPCRSATTMYLRIFSASGVQSYFQPLKNILRWRMQGGDLHWHLQELPVPKLFIKETIGPYVQPETNFNPLEILLQAGVPPQRISVLIIGRAPLASWSSWHQWWNGKVSVGNLIQSYRTTEKIRQAAQERGLKTVTLVYEAFREHPPEPVVQSLLDILGVPFGPLAVSGWHSLPPYGTPGSGVVLPDEPPLFVIENIHNRAEKLDGIDYYPRDRDLPDLKKDDVRALIDSHIHQEIYENWRKSCEKDFKISISPDTMMQSVLKY
jgi:hypothetical protein